VTDETGPGTPPTAGRPTIRCEQCGQQVPALAVCVRCGDPLGPELRKGQAGRVRDSYAAAPEESARAVRLVSTLYPALPREEIRTFQTALVAGAILVVVLAALGFFPVAVVAAAVLVPIITVIYLYDVDTYEDAPVRVVALTFLWGLLAGGAFAWLLDQVVPVTAVSSIGGSVVGGGGGAPFPWERGIVAPIVAGVLMALGPILLLGQKRFNDVLDGATFGVASAVAFVGAQTIITSISLFKSGLQPAGDVLPWIVRLIGLGVAMPVIAAGAIGGFVGVLWLRHRGPDEHEDMLGPLGKPVVAAVLAGALLVAAGLVQALVRSTDVVMLLLELVILVALAIVALIWLRRIIHLGLLQESLEIAIGPDIACANCGKATPSHSYCGECGVSLRALPKSRGKGSVAVGGVAPASAVAGGIAAPHEVKPTVPDLPAGAAGAAVAAAGGPITLPGAPAPARRGWLGPQKLLILFAVLLGAITAVSLVVAFVVSQGLDQPECEGLAPCGAAIVAPRVAAAATRADAPFPPLERYRDDATGFSLEYDPAVWSVQQSDAGFLLLSAFNGALAYIVEAAPADRLEVQALFNARRDLLSQRLLGFQLDREPARLLIGNAILGHRKGIGALFGGTLDSPQGPSTDFAVAQVASTDGQIVAVTTILTPAEARDFGLALADTINNTFTWPSDPVVE
jgi:RsiW-degrading membrane proteinase PrsW (M82 family)